jgi:glutamate-ammonia-ligase adenylyltransferase
MGSNGKLIPMDRTILPDLNSEEWARAEKSSEAIHRYNNIIKQAEKTKLETELNFEDQLRIQRHRHWTLAAAHTLLKKTSAKIICQNWSLQADHHLSQCMAEYLPVANNPNIRVVAMGKLGAGELNLSSDIDIFFVSKDSPTEKDHKYVKKVISALSHMNEYGFVHRVDTDLKPGGRMAPIICSIKQMSDYYWSSGKSWERLALTRARIVDGSDELSNEIYQILKKFSYRKFVDYTLLNDLQSLRTQIHYHLNSDKNQEFHLKLAPGAIRDVELFIHSLLIMHGGRLKEIQTESTDQAIVNLRNHSLFDDEELIFLQTIYWEYRQLENAVQAANDEQTHILKKSTAPTEHSRCLQIAQKVDSIVDSIIGKTKTYPAISDNVEEQKRWLTELGFVDEKIFEIWLQLNALSIQSIKSAEHDDLRKKFLYTFMINIRKHALDTKLAVSLLYDFIKATRAKASLYALLLRAPQVIEDLSILFGQSPYVGHLISSRPEILEALMQPRIRAETKDWQSLLDYLTEQKLVDDVIATKQFLTDFNLFNLGQQLTAAADANVLQILNLIKHDAQCPDLNILALGKWGGREMGFRSDLDFIFYCQNEITENHHKAVRRFIKRLTEQNRGGQLYSIDMRLRPSGQAGPIIVEQHKLLQYLSNKASAWERQAYLKARSISETNISFSTTSINKGLQDSDLLELKNIQQKLWAQNMEGNIDIKMASGGLIDIELALQTYILQNKIQLQSTHTNEMFDALISKQPHWIKLGSELKTIYNYLRQIEQLQQIVSQVPGSTINSKSDATVRVAGILKLSMSTFFENVNSKLRQSEQLLNKLDPRRFEK